MKAKKRTVSIGIVSALIVFILILFGLGDIRVHAPVPPAAKAPAQQQPAPKPAAPKAFNKQQYSISDPASLWAVINKKRPLPSSYNPGLRSETSQNMNSLIAGAKAAGHNLKIISSYRSYATQASTYNGYVARDGQAAADTYSARPGHSEHQTGLAADLGNGTCDLEICFGTTAAGKWLGAHAHEYGFIIRYQAGKEQLTGYQYEPWHIRYVGVELASQIYSSGQTLEEFFGLSAATSY